MRLALYQPDIPQNTGTILRLAACLTLPVDIIEPCGFLLDDRRLRRSGMDYLAGVVMMRHRSWQEFLASRRDQRVVLLTTCGNLSHLDFAYDRDDILLLGRESGGVPPEVHSAAAAGVRVPMAAGSRSLNVAVAAAIVAGEALRQTGLFPGRAAP